MKRHCILKKKKKNKKPTKQKTTNWEKKKSQKRKTKPWLNENEICGPAVLGCADFFQKTLMLKICKFPVT